MASVAKMTLVLPAEPAQTSSIPRLRVLIVCSHPVQYATPIFQVLAKDSRVDVQVAYCSMQGAEPAVDPGFGVEVRWDIPLLSGYSWQHVPNHSWSPRLDTFFGLFNLGIWRLISRGKFDAVVVHTGYVCATFWIAAVAAKWKRARFLFGTDAHDLSPRDAKKWKVWIKRRLWPCLFRLADSVLVVSSGGVALMRSLRIPEDRITLVPFCVDNGWWIENSDRVGRAAVRARWKVPENATVVLFCAKLQPWKRPQDLLRAFAQVSGPNTHLVFAGDGALRSTLESEAKTLGVDSRVLFLGFANQSVLPEVYTASDLFVLPSEYEPFGLVVNEAMLCQRPVIVSDRVGARFDLVREGETGYIFPCGDVDALARILQRALSDPPLLHRMGAAAREQMAGWSHVDYARALVNAICKIPGTRGDARITAIV
jgi:glycosyltransferase involved in cell wall biosynthesis